MGVLYVCDEPSIGLHPVDDERLIRTLRRLRDMGNTVIVVEHDEAMMRAADWISTWGLAPESTEATSSPRVQSRRSKQVPIHCPALTFPAEELFPSHRASFGQ